MDDQHPVRRVLRLQPRDGAIVDDAPLIDHHDPLAQAFDVAHVVRRQDHGGLVGLVQLLDEAADALLGQDVEPDGRLVQIENPRLIQHRRGEIAAHALAEAELTHRCVDKEVESEHVNEPTHVPRVQLVGHPVHLFDQLERLDQRQIPPELRALAEDDADVQRVVLAIAPGDESPDHDLAGRGHKDSSEHLDRGRLARTVWPEVAN